MTLFQPMLCDQGFTQGGGGIQPHLPSLIIMVLVFFSNIIMEEGETNI